MRGHAFLVLFSAVIALAHRIIFYRTDYPEEAADFPEAARRLVQTQPDRWEPKLAQVLLHEKIARLDQAYIFLEDQRKYIGANREVGIGVLVQFSQLRIRNAERLLRAMQGVLLDDVANCFSYEAETSPLEKVKRITRMVGAVQMIYADSLRFEEEVHQVAPVESLRKGHEPMRDWSQPIRDALADLLRFLQELIDAEDEGSVNFEIKLEAPKNLGEFCEFLDGLSG